MLHSDALRRFRIGYSWAGPVSLAVPYDLRVMRTKPAWPGVLVRFDVVPATRYRFGAIDLTGLASTGAGEAVFTPSVGDRTVIDQGLVRFS